MVSNAPLSRYELDGIIEMALHMAIDTKIDPMVQRIVSETVGGLLSEFANQVTEQFMVADEKLEQRIDEIIAHLTRLEAVSRQRKTD